MKGRCVVVPAKAGIQGWFQKPIMSRPLRGDDGRIAALTPN